MKFAFSCIILCLGLFAQAQEKLDYGEVKIDSNFNCVEIAKWNLKYIGVGDICDSKNELEIRLNAITRSGNVLIILSYNNNAWNVNKYSFKQANTEGIQIESVVLQKDSESAQMHETILKSVFDTLKKNNIFLLPNQNEFFLKTKVYDGINYQLTYKVNRKFRYYSFSNPQSFQNENETLYAKEVNTQYSTIVRIINLLFN